MEPRKMARGLAWFGIGLGLVETFAPRTTARSIGLDEHAGTIRAFGLREVVSGGIVLAARRPEDWLWLRVVGDGLDGALLASGLRPSNRHGLRALLATMAVAPVVALDVLYAHWPRL